MTEGQAPQLSRSKLFGRGLARMAVVLASLDVILLAAAGRTDWTAAWALTAIFVIFLLAVLAWGVRYAPDLLEERSKPGANVKWWDKVIMQIYSALLLALLVTAGLDAERYHWSSVPFAVQVIGAAGIVITAAIIWWCMAANRFLSSRVRIQDDRGHEVAQGGPYRYVRHPMYAALMVLLNCVALELGSWWTLVPGGLIAVMLVIRTALEDRTLQKELPGYREYAARVKYRLVPGLW